eukprot:1488598-Heterocapsa_arctica.AAC.1
MKLGWTQPRFFFARAEPPLALFPLGRLPFTSPASADALGALSSPKGGSLNATASAPSANSRAC